MFGAPPERQNCLRSCSEGNSHPVDVSSTATLDYTPTEPTPPTETTDTDTSALADLAELLTDHAVRSWALAPTPTENRAIKVDSGTAGQLVRRAQLGTRAAAWAVVATPRPELVALDVDECADLVLPEIRQAAADTATEIVAAVASGRPDCLHLWCVPATPHGRTELLRRIATIRRHHNLPAVAIDHRDGTAIRLPGSVSLKSSGQPSALIDLDTGAHVGAQSVLRAARKALPTRTRTAAPKARPRQRPAPTTAPLPLNDAVLPHPVTEAPRAWRQRTPFTAEEWAVLNDADGRDRSAAATAAAWVLWRHGIRSVTAALWWYQRVAAFEKFRRRDEEARAVGRTVEWPACAQHWAAIARRARAHRPPTPAADEGLIAAAREEIRWWDDAELQAAAAVVIDRYDDGYGVTDRPLARRDLQLELHLSDGVATARIEALVRRGLLVLTAPWAPASPREAARYSLAVPAATYRGESAHDITSPSAPLRHALWGTLTHACRRLLLTLLSSPNTPARSLSSHLRLPLGDQTYGLRHLLHRLEAAGLATRTGTGRATTWSAAPSLDLDAAASRTGALTRARELAARICGERACWHAESHAESARSHRGLAALRRRITHSDVRGSQPRTTPVTGPRATHPRRRHQLLGTTHSSHSPRPNDPPAPPPDEGPPRGGRARPDAHRRRPRSWSS